MQFDSHVTSEEVRLLFCPGTTRRKEVSLKLKVATFEVLLALKIENPHSKKDVAEL